ncbi:MAG: helix-turn-helix transcriptional regulator [Chitinispirillaceae bacterium]|nr:helix-turn-helix transcriptional regulator [Chitinispirillaceae bacterium]
MRHEELRKKALNKKSVKKEFDRLEPEYALVSRMLAARKKAGMTQADVAKRMGTKTPSIARLERSLITGNHSPSVYTLRKYAEAVNCRLDIKLASGKR